MINARTLTRSGLSISELGLGCATLAFDPHPDAISGARQLLADAQDAGLGYFDTAPFYGRGLSERLVGDAVRRRAGVVLSSKVGRLLHPDPSASTHMPFRFEFDYTYDGVMRSVEDSFQRLGLTRIDILFAHDLGRQAHGENAAAQFANFFDGGGYRAMDELRKSGDVAAIGLGVNEVAICEQAMACGNFDLFLLAGRHTLLERTGSLEFFDACAKVGTDVVIGGPFNSGLLVGGTTYNYGAIPPDVATHHKKLLAYCTSQGVDIGAAALQFPLRHAVVKSVVPGPKTPDELCQILGWFETKIDNDFWAGLEALEV